ncbi:MAG: Na(+)/H(+) antiporter subunit D [Syntrophomonadaceae bacterium]|nr:Na(+)/H(+) antiporter subunit D [Syntrophomonadaceae bacterium]
MTSFIPPSAVFIAGAFLLPFFKGKLQKLLIILLPVLAFISMHLLPTGNSGLVEFLEYILVFNRVDRLSLVFGNVFIIMAFAGAIYSLHEKDISQIIAAFIYVGSALGAVFAGDYITLYIFWEAMAFSSVYLIAVRKTDKARGASFRYILVHLFGGMLLLAGIILHINATGSIEFNFIGLNGLASYLILIGFAINAAIPPLSAWLSDAYPEATVIGTVFLSAFTTKTAVYTLARAFPGTDILIWAGIIMALYGIVFAILENDMRRILSYSIINQVGFMVVGIGIGTPMALNGAVSHAFAHILYKGLLMMSAGAVLYTTGRSKCTELGGLYKSMPITLGLCLIGAASISAFPLTSGFVTKSMIADAAAHEGLTTIWMLLTMASAGVFLHAGIKFPYFVFFAKDSGLRPKEPPLNMLIGMGVPAFLCIFIGIFPQSIYQILPFAVDYVPYTSYHVITQLQLLMFSGLAFFVLLKYLQRTDTITLDTDWFYRRGGQIVVNMVGTPLVHLSNSLSKTCFETIPGFLIRFGENPTAAIKIGVDTMAVWADKKMGRTPPLKKLVREKKIYPRSQIKPLSIGAGVAFILFFFIMMFLIILNII